MNLDMNPDMMTIKVHLKNGNIFKGLTSVDEWDGLCNQWLLQSGKLLTFDNGSFLMSEIAGLEWKV